MRTTKHSQFTIPCAIQAPPPSSQSEVNCGVFEKNKRADPLKWAIRSPIGHSFPPHQASNIPSNFRRHKHSRLSVTWPIHQPARHPTVYCGIANHLDRGRRTNSACPSRFGQGIKLPRGPNFSLKVYPIKQSCRLFARRNPITPKHQGHWTWCCGGVDMADLFYCSHRLRRRAWDDVNE